MKCWSRSTSLVGSAVSLWILSTGLACAQPDVTPDDLLDLSLEQLTNMQVTSVSKKSEKILEAAAAIYVITQDDIKRSGFTTIPEALRMVPGLTVAQSGSHQWAIGSRGYTNQFSNKLLVLIDGRSVYTPLFSGVYWDAQDTMMEDIDRIEVIRGPGATLWGANAVNGVINIITKQSKDTQGGLAAFSTGTMENANGRVRYGTKMGDKGYMRAYAKYNDRDDVRTLANASADDEWNKSQMGFRADMEASSNLSYTVQGDMYRMGDSFVLKVPTLAASPYTSTVYDREQAKGGNLLARANYKESDQSDWTLQMYYDNAQRDNFVLNDTHHTFDMDLQHAWTPAASHEIVWGLGYRYVLDSIGSSFYNRLTPDSRGDNLFNMFVQDKIAIVPEKFFVTIGSKFEKNDYTGFELQPSARMTWLVDEKQTLWASAAHAVRTPNRFSDDGSILISVFPGAPPTAYIGTVSNPNLQSEKLNAYEMGYRIQPTEKTSVDIATFYNDYGALVSNSLGSPRVVSIPGYAPYALVPITPVNGNSGRAFGGELAASWDVADYWKLQASYSYLDFKLKNPQLTGFTVAGLSPEQRVNVMSTLELPHNVEMNNAVYYVDSLPGARIGDYIRFDTRLAWQATDAIELSLVGQNLLDPRHKEFSAFVYQNASQVPRSVYGNVAVKF